MLENAELKRLINKKNKQLKQYEIINNSLRTNINKLKVKLQDIDSKSNVTFKISDNPKTKGQFNTKTVDRKDPFVIFEEIPHDLDFRLSILDFTYRRIH